jgi:hypothetical protein
MAYRQLKNKKVCKPQNGIFCDAFFRKNEKAMKAYRMQKETGCFIALFLSRTGKRLHNHPHKYKQA